MPVRSSYPRGTACWLAHGSTAPAAAAAFYAELLGWTIEPEPGTPSLLATLGGHPVASFGPGPGGWLVCLSGDVTDPPDAWQPRFGPIDLPGCRARRVGAMIEFTGAEAGTGARFPASDREL